MKINVEKQLNTQFNTKNIKNNQRTPGDIFHCLWHGVRGRFSRFSQRSPGHKQFILP